MKTKLRKTIIILVVVSLILLPNLFAFADNVEPTPTPLESTGEVTPVPDESIEPDASPGAPQESPSLPTEPEASPDGPQESPDLHAEPQPTPKKDNIEPTSEIPTLQAASPNIVTASKGLITKTLTFKKNPGLKNYTYSYTYHYWKRGWKTKTETGTVTGNGSVQVKLSHFPRSTSVTIQAHATSDYDFDEWTHSSPGIYSQNPTSFLMPIWNVTAEAKFKQKPLPKFSLKLIDANGLDRYTVNGTNYNGGDTVQLVAGTAINVTSHAKANYECNGWDITPSGAAVNASTVSFVLNGDSEVKGKFKRTHYNLELKNCEGLLEYTVTNGGSSTVHSGGDSIAVPVNANISVTATPVRNYVNDGWESAPAGSTETDSTVQFTMNDNKVVKARMNRTHYDLNLKDNTGLQEYIVSYNGSSTSHGAERLAIPIGVAVTVEAKATDCFEFAKWTNASPGSPSSNPISFNMNSDKAAQATFNRTHFNLKLESTTGLGKYVVDYLGISPIISMGGEIIKVPVLAVVSVKAHPATGYDFDKWLSGHSSGLEKTNPVLISMSSNKTAKAKFVLATKKVTFKPFIGLDRYTYSFDGSGGDIVVRPNSTPITIEIPKDKVVTVRAYEKPNFAFTKWAFYTPGTKNNNQTVFTLTSNECVGAEFLRTHFNLTFKNSEGLSHYTYKYSGTTLQTVTIPSGTPSIVVPIPVFADVTVQAFADINSGYVFDRWTLHSIGFHPHNPTSFPMLSDRWAKGLFKKLPKFTVYHQDYASDVGSGQIEVFYNGSYVTTLDANSNTSIQKVYGVDTVQLKAKPASDSIFVKWRLKNSTNPNETFDIQNIGSCHCAMKVIAKPEWKHAPGSFTVIKKSKPKKQLLSGAHFTLSNADGYSQSGVTGANGRYTWSNLEPGTYTLTETSAPSGYNIATGSPFTIKILPGKHKSKKVFNFEKPITITTIKKDINTGEPLEGAEFAIFKASDMSTELGRRTTDSSGIATFDASLGLLSGIEYWIKEVGAPTGYQLDPASATGYSVIVNTPGGQNETPVLFENTPLPGSLMVTKKSTTGILLAGAEFTLTGDLYNESGVTDSNGELLFDNIPPGDYVLTETNAPTNFYILQSTYNITIDKDEDDTQEVINEEYVEIVAKKIDKLTGNPVQGAVFEIYLVTSTPPISVTAVSITPIAQRTSGPNGLAVFEKSLGLRAGNTYLIKEITAPSGYNLDSECAAGYNASIPIPGGSNIEEPVLFANTPKTGDLHIVKKDVDREDVLLPGVVFTLTGTTLDASGNVVPYSSTLTTNASGEIFVEGLMPGEYILTEITPPFGYEPVSNPQTVTIVSEETTNLTVYNRELERGSIVLAKFKKGDHSTRLFGVKFALYKISVSPANKIGSSKYTDPNGNIVWSNILPGNYVLVEEATINGYKMPSTNTTSVTLLPGTKEVVVIDNEAITTKPTPKPTPTSTSSTTETPEVTATPTPVPSDEVTIDEEDPAYGPDTGEGTTLFITIGALLLIAVALFIVRKKLVHKN